jgi:VIT1/CCC1 family predicted Fe2+/Mn2+ transporter
MTSRSFDAVLAMKLGPSPGHPDDQFALKVTRRIAAEELLQRSRWALLRNLARDLAALSLFAGALVIIARFLPPALPAGAVLSVATLLLALWLAVALSNRSGAACAKASVMQGSCNLPLRTT